MEAKEFWKEARRLLEHYKSNESGIIGKYIDSLISAHAEDALGKYESLVRTDIEAVRGAFVSEGKWNRETEEKFDSYMNNPYGSEVEGFLRSVYSKGMNRRLPESVLSVIPESSSKEEAAKNYAGMIGRDERAFHDLIYDFRREAEKRLEKERNSEIWKLGKAEWRDGEVHLKGKERIVFCGDSVGLPELKEAYGDYSLKYLHLHGKGKAPCEEPSEYIHEHPVYLGHLPKLGKIDSGRLENFMAEMAVARPFLEGRIGGRLLDSSVSPKRFNSYALLSEAALTEMRSGLKEVLLPEIVLLKEEDYGVRDSEILGLVLLRQGDSYSVRHSVPLLEKHYPYIDLLVG